MDLMNAGNKGLANLGNTCYMNSALQCLSHLLEFHPKNEYFLNENKNNDDIYGAWLELQLELWQNDEGSMIVPKPFLQKFINECQDKDICFYNFNQNGTEEFINIFHQSIKKIIICLY
jgi:ubiquitin carboxyl-terminal hydrolase 4/11/15